MNQSDPPSKEDLRKLLKGDYYQINDGLPQISDPRKINDHQANGEEA